MLGHGNRECGGGRGSRTGWCYQSSFGSIAGWVCSASGLWQASAWCGRTCGSVEIPFISSCSYHIFSAEHHHHHLSIPVPPIQQNCIFSSPTPLHTAGGHRQINIAACIAYSKYNHRKDPGKIHTGIVTEDRGVESSLVVPLVVVKFGIFLFSLAGHFSHQGLLALVSSGRYFFSAST